MKKKDKQIVTIIFVVLAFSFFICSEGVNGNIKSNKNGKVKSA